MGIAYGVKSKRVTSSDINQIIFANGTIVDQGDDAASGGYFIKFQFNTSGCGGPDGYVRIELKDNFPWSKITYEVFNSGTAACWSYNQSYTGDYSGNLLPFDAAQDRVFNSVNSFELPQYQIKMTACDNNSNNFLHSSFKTGATNSFFVTRRRSTSTSLAQITHQRSCNSTGSSAFVIIRNIFIF